MRTVNETVVAAPVEICFRTAADVERWPEILPHYRRVRFHRKDGFGRGRVEMAAYRHFGPLPYPVWWESEMEADPEEPVVRYHHVAGITEDMDVWWRFHRLEAASGEGPSDAEGTGGGATPTPPRTRIEIVHEWTGPGWPVIGGFAARRVIGPHFVMVVADRTLAGIRRKAEELRSREDGAVKSGEEADGAADEGAGAP